MHRTMSNVVNVNQHVYRATVYALAITFFVLVALAIAVMAGRRQITASFHENFPALVQGDLGDAEVNAARHSAGVCPCRRCEEAR